MTRRLAVVLASCVLAASACTGGSSSTSTTSATYREADVVAWSDQVCGVVVGVARPASDEPLLDLNDPETLKSGLSAWLDGNIATADRSINELRTLQNGPHPKSKDLATAAEGALDKVKTLFADTRSQVGATADPTQIVTAVAQMMTKAGQLEPAGASVRQKFTESGMAAHWQQAQNCRQLQPPDASPAPTPTS